MVISQMDCKCILVNTSIFAYSSCSEHAFHFHFPPWKQRLCQHRGRVQRLLHAARGEQATKMGRTEEYGDMQVRKANTYHKQKLCNSQKHRGTSAHTVKL